eukprot:GHVP01059466.1.p1 GENE.GHVP01059466.1~~GHVP01059466.1.p1  ORF type:complete len:144 (-),score=30.68 GHVP01059466.1:310-741(-)
MSMVTDDKKEESKACFTPSLKWAQNKEYLYLTVDSANSSNVKTLLEGNLFTYNAKRDSDDCNCHFQIHFFDEVQEISIKVSPLNVLIIFLKKEKIFWQRLTAKKEKNHFISIDWGRWVDESDDEKAGDGNDFADLTEAFKNEA